MLRNTILPENNGDLQIISLTEASLTQEHSKSKTKTADIFARYLHLCRPLELWLDNTTYEFKTVLCITRSRSRRMPVCSRGRARAECAVIWRTVVVVRGRIRNAGIRNVENPEIDRDACHGRLNLRLTLTICQYNSATSVCQCRSVG